MKIEEVPQDESSLSKGNVRELIYATDEEGNYTTAKSSGWAPKTIALSNSLEEINERIRIAGMRVERGEVSPLVYYMEVHRMDVAILSQYVGMWKWRVKRHFRPEVFAKLSDRILIKYAAAFDISIAELKQFKPK